MQTKVKEAEHSPSPQPSRGIYGFIFATLCAFFIISYGLWIIIPSDIIQTWPYQPPQKYWAAAVPIFFCTAFFVFAFFLYPSLHQINDGQLDEASALTDCHAHAIPRETRLWEGHGQDHTLQRKLSLDLTRRRGSGDKRVDELRELPIPAASDIDIEYVSKLLYLDEE